MAVQLCCAKSRIYIVDGDARLGNGLEGGELANCVKLQQLRDWVPGIMSALVADHDEIGSSTCLSK